MTDGDSVIRWPEEHRPEVSQLHAVNELQRGRTVVLVELREIPAGDARDQFEQLGRAA